MKKIFIWALITALLMPVAPVFAEDAEEGSVPDSITAAAIMNDYVLQPEDVVQINVYEEPELTVAVRVSPSGEIVYPLLGTLKVSGYTVAKLRDELIRLLEADYLVSPQVQVFIQSYHSRSVSVTGSVSKPGSYQIPAGKQITMMQVIAMAGGFTKAAAVQKVRIIRSEGGKPVTITVNANDIIKRGDKNKDVEVQPNDVIFVPESWI